MKPRVLIVDDDETNLELLSAKMERVGYEVSKAVNGMEALEKIASFNPDIVLLDVVMPVMDGLEVLRHMKSGADTRYIPVILLTGRVEIEDRVMGLEVGAEDYISKPYSLQEVAARVKSLLRMRALQSRLREKEKMSALGAMVNGIAHEVRNPLVTIGGMARRLLDHETDEQHKQYAGAIISSVERLERMMKRIDEYSKVLVSRLDPGDVNFVLGIAVKDAKDYAELIGKKVLIEIQPAKSLPQSNIDVSNLRIAIFNIIQNSIEAVEKNGRVVVESALVDEKTIEIKITDNGVGIEPDDIISVFNPFKTSKIEGAGLGLTIAHRIILDHGGDILMTSAPASGTVVTIKLRPVEAK